MRKIITKNAAEFIDPFVIQDLGRTLNERELSRALRQSLVAEEEAIHLYEALADATDNNKVKRVLQDVADEEKVHVGEFQQLLDDLLSDEKELIDEGREEIKDI